MARITGLALCLLLASCGGSSDSDQVAREAEFEKSMNNVVLDGFFTVTGRGDNAKLRKERYEISSATKIAGDLWTITSRIQYGEHDITAPVPVKILWAGDTPVITLTDIGIPGLGENFTARVAFYRDHYSGMWWHGEVGGNMYGVITPD